MTQKNENCLAGLKCPRCKGREPFTIAITCFTTVWDDGFDHIDSTDAEWDEESTCTCEICKYCGTVKDFHEEDEDDESDSD